MVQLKRDLDTKQKKNLPLGMKDQNKYAHTTRFLKNVLKKKTFF